MSETLLSIWRGPIATPRDRVAEVLSEVATRHRTTVDLIKSDCRFSEVVHARQEAMYRLRSLLREDGSHRLSFPRIGQILNRDHTTVLHGMKRHAWRIGQ
jgi:chromosomal replication initiation ATPase DnaA